MKTNHSKTLAILTFITASLLALTCSIGAQIPRFQITAFTDRGGGVSTGSPFSVMGTSGQSDVGSVTNGIYSVGGGFWSVVQTPSGPILSIERLANGAVRVFWPRPGTDFLIDEQGATPNGTAIPWRQIAFPYQTNTTHISITVPTPTGNRIFRLRKP